MYKYKIQITRSDNTSFICANSFNSKELASLFIKFSSKAWPACKFEIIKVLI